jgi:hypothetical protein
MEDSFQPRTVNGPRGSRRARHREKRHRIYVEAAAASHSGGLSRAAHVHVSTVSQMTDDDVLVGVDAAAPKTRDG